MVWKGEAGARPIRLSWGEVNSSSERIVKILFHNHDFLNFISRAKPGGSANSYIILNVLSSVKQAVSISYQENPYSEINFLQDFTP